MTTPSRPPLRYHGSKWRIAPWVISHFPPHRVYVEPFGGAAGVLLQKRPAASDVWNDLNGDLVNFFRLLRAPEGVAMLVDALRRTPFARDEYETLYDIATDPVDQARRFIARSFMGFSSKGAERASGFDNRLNNEGHCSAIRSLRASTDEISAVADRFASVIIENRPALEVIAAFDRRDTLFFVDPPYLADTHSSPGIYRHDMSALEHARLLDGLDQVAGMVVISGYPSALYDRRLADWAHFETSARTEHARERSEVLWLNPAAARASAESQGALFG